jgi:hypothetical protein
MKPTVSNFTKYEQLSYLNFAREINTQNGIFCINTDNSVARTFASMQDMFGSKILYTDAVLGLENSMIEDHELKISERRKIAIGSSVVDMLCTFKGTNIKSAVLAFDMSAQNIFTTIKNKYLPCARLMEEDVFILQDDLSSQLIFSNGTGDKSHIIFINSTYEINELIMDLMNEKHKNYSA